MSIRVMTAVWDHALGVNGGPLLVLLALADYANDDGTGAYPKQATLAAKTRLSERHVRRVLASLEDKAYIERMGRTPGGVVEWRVEPSPDILSARSPVSDETGPGCPTEPSTEPPEEEADASPLEAKDFSRYRDPATPGSAAAPWLVLELGRLMRANDPKAKLPVGLRELMADEYIDHFEHGKAFATPEKRRELLLPVLDNKGLVTWLDAMRLLIDADEREIKEAVRVLRWCQADDFWKTNILGAPKFRKQYPQLRLKWLEDGGDASHPTTSGTRPPDRGPTTTAQLDAMTRRPA